MTHMGADRTELAKRAAAKRAKGERLTRDEERAITWWQAKQRDEILDAGLRAIPKGMYCSLAQRQQKVVDEQARRYGLPLLGPTVDLFAAIAALHDLISRNADALKSDGQPNLAAEKLSEQIRNLRTRRRLILSELKRRKDEFIPRTELRGRLQWLAQQLRRIGESLGRRFGRDAQAAVNEFLTALTTEIQSATKDNTNVATGEDDRPEARSKKPAKDRR